MVMRMVVRSPAGLPFSSRSSPTAPPRTTESRSWTNSSSRSCSTSSRQADPIQPLTGSGVLAERLAAVAHRRLDVVAVELRDELDADLLRARRLALVVIGAGAEALGVHLGHHLAHALPAL